MHRIMKATLLASIFMMVIGSVQAETPRQQLAQMVQLLQHNPNDNALREKIIKLVQHLKPAPAVPEEANRRMTRGTLAFKEAKSEADFQEAATEYQQATLAAPWFADAYYNLGVAQNKANDFAAAAQSLKLYLLAAPDAPDAKAAQNLLYEMEYKQEKVDKEKSVQATQQAGEQARAQKEAQFYKQFDGGMWRIEQGKAIGGDGAVNRYDLDTRNYIFVNGHEMTRHFVFGGSPGSPLVERDLWKTVFTSRNFDVNGEDRQKVNVMINENGDQITTEYTFVVDYNGPYRVTVTEIWRRTR